MKKTKQKSENEVNNEKALYCSIINGLVSASGYATNKDSLKKKADELFFGIKQEPYKY